LITSTNLQNPEELGFIDKCVKSTNSEGFDVNDKMGKSTTVLVGDWLDALK
jgi:hypothetical protein